MRDYVIYHANLLASNVAGWVDGQFNTVLGWSYARDRDVTNLHANTVAWVRWFAAGAPWPFNVAIGWLTDLLVDHIVDRIVNALHHVTGFFAYLVFNTFNWGWNHYQPSVWAKLAIWSLRDRLVNVLDFAQDVANSAGTYARQYAEVLTDGVLWIINGLDETLSGLTSYVYTTIATGIASIRLTLDDARIAIGNLQAEVREINQDPTAWIWRNLEGNLKGLMEDWLLRYW